MMSFILRQIIENNIISPPVVIHITDAEVRIGKKFKISLERFPQISRHHATIFQTDHKSLLIRDEGSLNGTFVNDVKITGKILKSLSVGDRIGFGIPCKEPNNGLVCIVCWDDPPYKVKDEVIVISDNDDEVPADNCPKEVNVDSSEDEVSAVNNYNDANNFDFKIVNCTSKAKVKASFSSNDPSGIPPTVKINTNSTSSFPSTFATKARKSFVGSSTKIHRSSPPCDADVEICAPVAETHTTKTLKTVNLSKSNTTTSLNYYEIQSFKLNDSDDKKFAIRNVKVEAVSNSASTFSNCTTNSSSKNSYEGATKSVETTSFTSFPYSSINSSSKNSYEDTTSSLTADGKLLLNNNVADCLTTKKLKTINTTHSLSTEASINSHLPYSSNKRSSRTSFYHKSVEIGAPKIVNSRSVNIAKDAIDSSNQIAENNTVFDKIATPGNKHIRATKFIETTSLTSVPYSSINSSSKNSYKDTASSLTADEKLLLNYNVVDSLTTKKLKNVNTTHLDNLSTEASINSHLSYSSNERSSRTSFYQKSVEIGAPKTVNSRNTSNDKDSIDSSNQIAVNNAVIHKITTPCNRHIGATKSFETTSLTSVPDSSKRNYKRKSSIENLPRKECTVYLVKCDSDAFKFPPDVKNPFLKKRNNVPKASVHKRVKKHSRNSKSGALNLENEPFHNIEDQESNTTMQPNIEKRKSSVDEVLDTYPQKKVCLTSKREDVTCTKKKPRFNVGSESDSDNNEITYSQVEEVIDIRDDDIYLDFQSSQNFVYIKKEPGEIENEHEDEIYAEIFENDNEYDNLDDKASQLDDNFVESIESIKAFVGCNDEKEQKELENNLADDNKCLENSFFPVLSQGFESEEENNNNNSKSCSKKVPSSPDSQDLSEEEVYYKEEPIKERKVKELSKIKLTDPKSSKAFHLTGEQRHKKRQDKKNNSNNKSKSYSKNVPTGADAQNLLEEIYYIEEPLRNGKDKGISKINQKEKKLSKIKLCEPKPLSYRPMYKKGRDEDFVERSKPLPISKSSKNTPKNFKKQSLTKEENIDSRSNFNKFKIPLKRALPQSDQSEAEPYKEDSSRSNLPGSSSKKSLSVKRRPEKFASRMGFLTNEIEINPRKLNKPVSKVSGIVRQNNSSLLGKQNNLANNIHNSGVCNQSSESVVAQSPASAQSSAYIVSQNSTPIVTPRLASNVIPMCAPVITPRPASVITSRAASDGFHISASISVQNSAVAINAGKKPTDSLQIPNKNDIIRTRDPRQNRVAHSSKQPEITPASTTISDKRNVNYKSSNSNNQSPGDVKNNYPNNLIMNSLRFSIIKNLLKLQTGWLEEQKDKKVPPPPVYEGADYLELRFKSYESYLSSFCPMLMLELWEQMYVDYKEIIDSRKQYKKFYFSILSYTSRGDCIALKCESVVNDKTSFLLREGNLVILKLKENAHRCSPAFGYIFDHKVQSLDLKNLKNLTHWKNLPKGSGWLTNAKHYTFFAYVKRRDKPFAMDELMKGNGLSYIGNKLRLLDALSYMKNSPLMSDFLAPRWNTFLVNYSKCPPSMEYNSCQVEVINGVSAEISKSSETSKIILLQGPPGTGKTHTIIGLLKKLIHDKKFSQNFKVLVAAPSNSAIDEIGCRLIEVNKKLPSPGIKFVRIGAFVQVNPKMKPHFIDKKARELFEKNSKSAYNQKNNELQKLSMQMDNLREQPDSMHRNERMQHLEHRYKLCYNRVSSKNMDYYTETYYKSKIIKESHIILSTLSSCGLTILLKTFKPNSGIYFSCCIVDECTQCTELEILQPLVLGINKLILVGDHKQLPATVTSKLACKYGFERSAFERFHLFFEKYLKKTPMYTLSEQFRMHSAICEFPSRYIYDKKIFTHPDTDLKYKSFPFHPYFILDIPSQESDDSSSKINCAEASVIVHICTGLIDIVDSSSIGIITPYQAQRSLYVNTLKVNPHYQNIEVNTVDGFQGREKDIIILSCVRANSQSGSIGFLACKRRLNVAITRARKCLIICAHADSLMNNRDWRELIFDAKRRNLYVGVSSPKDIPMIFKYNLKKDRSNLC